MATIGWLLPRGIDVNAKRPMWDCNHTALHMTVESGALDIAKLLLDAGADPNTQFVSPDEWKLRFTALTGAMGGGEMGQPEHPRAEPLARLLLDRGANPNDGQGLYNTHLIGDEPKWLTLLFAYGLSKDDPINWDAGDAVAAAGSPHAGTKILDYLIAQAAANGHTRRLACLLQRGADPNARSTYDGKTCYHSALLAGHREAAELLLAHGARSEPLHGQDAFIAACMVGDAQAARALLHGHPEYLGAADALVRAAQCRDVRAVKLMLELGFDPNRRGKHGHRALHVASAHRELVELLMQHGADARLRCFGGTPTTWALLAGDVAMARHHARASCALLDAVVSGDVELARELIARDPACVPHRAERATCVAGRSRCGARADRPLGGPRRRHRRHG